MLSKYLVPVIAGIVSLLLAFFAGMQYNAASEAEKVTEVVLEKIKEVVEVQDDLVDIGLDHADEEIDIRVQNRLIEEEVKRRVKEFTVSDSCLTPSGVLSISQALGYSEAENNEKPTDGVP